MRHNVVVESRVNDQPTHVYVMEKGIKSGKIERVFSEVVTGEYERLERGLFDEGAILDGSGDFLTGVTLILTTAGSHSISHIYVENI